MAITSGSKLGWSFLSSFSDCPTKWYLRNLAPWPGSPIRVDAIHHKLYLDNQAISGEPISGTAPELPVGLEPRRFSPALDAGTRFHAAIEAFYRSGVRDGVDTRIRSLDAALGAVGTAEHDSEPEHESVATARRLVERYCNHYTNDDIEVAIREDGQPMIEEELWLDLGFGGYKFTARLDMIYRRSGYLWALEHKTTAASSLGKLIQRFTLDGQVTGQFLQLASHFPNEQIGGVTLNAAVKDRGARSTAPEFTRRDYHRTHAQLEKFRLDLVRKLSQIDALVEQWMDLVTKGMDYDDAARAVFDASPSGYQCVGMGVACDFYSYCANREVASRLALDTFQPRSYKWEHENPLRVQPTPAEDAK